MSLLAAKLAPLDRPGTRPFVIDHLNSTWSTSKSEDNVNNILQGLWYIHQCQQLTEVSNRESNSKP
jgi:hypothetical protein